MSSERPAVYIETSVVSYYTARPSGDLVVAAVHGMDYLLTWNCRHMAHGAVMKMLPSATERAGYNAPVICTPQELVYDSREMD